MLAFYKRIRAHELRYYYVHDYQGSLFAPFAITAIWGRDSRKGRKTEYGFDSRGEMDRKIREILKRRARDGYRLLYSYPSINRYHLLFEDLREQAAG